MDRVESGRDDQSRPVRRRRRAAKPNPVAVPEPIIVVVEPTAKPKTRRVRRAAEQPVVTGPARADGVKLMGHALLIVVVFGLIQVFRILPDWRMAIFMMLGAIAALLIVYFDPPDLIHRPSRIDR